MMKKQASKSDCEKLAFDCTQAGWKVKQFGAEVGFEITQLYSPVSALGDFAIVAISGRAIESSISYNGGKRFKGLREARRTLENMTEILSKYP
jgi:hypothetical protein